MDQTDVHKVIESQEFKSLLAERRRLAMPIVSIIIAAYFGFVLLIAFDPKVLATTIGGGHVTVGIYAGLGLLILSFLLTSLYLKKSDQTIAALQKQIQDKFK